VFSSPSGKGNFYYPATVLTLTEGPSAPALNPTVASVVVGAPGLACVTVCSREAAKASVTVKQGYCDAAATKALTSEDLLKAQLTGEPGGAWRLPFLGQCLYAGAPQIWGGYAQFRHATNAQVCPASYTNAPAGTPMADVCWTNPLPQAKAICMCTADSTKQPASPGASAAVEQAEVEAVMLNEDSSAAPKANGAAPLITALMAGLVSVFAASSSRLRGRTLLLCAIAVLLLQCALLPVSVDAHNYIKSQHRARIASVINPCQERVGNQPHVQVIKDQKFEIEWSVSRNTCLRVDWISLRDATGTKTHGCGMILVIFNLCFGFLTFFFSFPFPLFC
jgi:hypothetical protein